MTTINQAAFDELMVIRDSGVTNMFAKSTVRELAFELGLMELSSWMDQNSDDYGSLIMGRVQVTR